ncbi:MAG: hypothetical protein OXI77_11540 [Chloroflexota bacterium]|nr:hypothetical protein [Chloroflexota bacterium]MDE2909565.1 hypothetical protein [Chloroflexota bacterium]
MPKQVTSTSNAPAAVGAYSQGVIAGGFVFTAEYIPLIPAALSWAAGGLEFICAGQGRRGFRFQPS